MRQLSTYRNFRPHRKGVRVISVRCSPQRDITPKPEEPGGPQGVARPSTPWRRAECLRAPVRFTLAHDPQSGDRP